MVLNNRGQLSVVNIISLMIMLTTLAVILGPLNLLLNIGKGISPTLDLLLDIVPVILVLQGIATIVIAGQPFFAQRQQL